MIAPKLLNRFLCVLLASLVVVGCDSNEDDEDGSEGSSAAELFVGSWEVTSAADMGGTRDQSAIFADQGMLSVDFVEEGTFMLVFDNLDEMEQDLSLEGPYTISESDMSVSLQVSINDLPFALPFTYRFVSDDTVELTTIDPNIAVTIGILLDAALDGNVVLVLERVG